jgi:dimethylargininase
MAQARYKSNMWIALTRDVSPSIARCELAYLERQPIDSARAVAQHRRYEHCLQELGLKVISLPPEPDLPDAVFVEDPVVVVDEVAVIARPGAESRRNEAETLAAAIAPYRPLRRMQAPATLDGGDVLRMGRTLYVGRTPRTNAEGIAQLAGALAPFGYRVQPVEVRDCLHLKSGCSALGEDTVLINRKWIDAAAFHEFQLVDVAAGETWAANVLSIGRTVVMPEGFPGTRNAIERLGWEVCPLDLSELMKAEAGVTCCSVIFET